MTIFIIFIWFINRRIRYIILSIKVYLFVLSFWSIIVNRSSIAFSFLTYIIFWTKLIMKVFYKWLASCIIKYITFFFMIIKFLFTFFLIFRLLTNTILSMEWILNFWRKWIELIFSEFRIRIWRELWICTIFK